MSTKYFRKWKTIVDTIRKKENDSASTIQRAYLSSKAREKKNRLRNIKDLLLKITIQKHNTSNNKLYIYFTRWLSKVRIMAINDNARVIQGFCRDILQKCKEQKELNNKLRMNNGLSKLFNIKFGKRYVFDKIKSENNRNIFKKFNDGLKNHKLNTLKECFDKIKNTAFDNKLRGALEIPDNLRKRILKKIITVWKENSDKTARKHGAETIIKNWKIYIRRKKKDNRDQIMRELIRKFKKNYDNGDNLNDNDDDTELIKKIDKFDNVLQTMIETKPEDYYREVKNMILNEFEKSRYEIAKFLDNYQGKKNNFNANQSFIQNLNINNDDNFSLNNEEITQFIVSISQICLFVLSNISFRLDYYSLAMNCLFHKIKCYMINYIDNLKKK